MSTTSRAFDHSFQSFGLSENPFHGSPDPRFFFAGSSYETALSLLSHGLQGRQGLLVLTGEPGTGKTLLTRQILQWMAGLNYSSSYVFHTHLNSTGLFELILRDFGLRAETSRKSDLLATLHTWLQSRQSAGDVPVVIIDEAQALSVRALSELCLLLNLENSNGKLLQIVLVGQTELEDKLRRPELRQLRQRIAVRCRLPLLSIEEAADYIEARLRCAGNGDRRVFPEATLEVLYGYAQGVPRVINLLCEKAMVMANAEKQSFVSPELMRQAAAGFDFGYEPQTPAPTPAHIALQTTTVIPLQPRAVARTPQTIELPLENPEGSETSGPAVQSEAIPEVIPEQTPAPPPPPMDPVAPISLMTPLVETILEVPAPSQPVMAEAKPKPNVMVFTPAASVEAPPVEKVEDRSDKSDRVPAEPRRSMHFRTRPESPFHRYWREVATSFARDWRGFLGAFQTRSAVGGKVVLMKKYDLKRDFVAPVSRWLSKPVHFKHNDKNPPGPRQAGRGNF